MKTITFDFGSFSDVSVSKNYCINSLLPVVKTNPGLSFSSSEIVLSASFQDFKLSFTGGYSYNNLTIIIFRGFDPTKLVNASGSSPGAFGSGSRNWSYNSGGRFYKSSPSDYMQYYSFHKDTYSLCCLTPLIYFTNKEPFGTISSTQNITLTSSDFYSEITPAGSNLNNWINWSTTTSTSSSTIGDKLIVGIFRTDNTITDTSNSTQEEQVKWLANDGLLNGYFKLNLTYGSGIVHYNNNGTWVNCIPYYYNNGWQQCIPYYYNNGWTQLG